VIELRLKNYINGKWTDSASQKSIKNINPANNQLVCTIPASNRQDVDKAVKAARTAFPRWKAVPAPERARILRKASQILEQQKDALGKLMCREMGKVLQECLGDVQEGIDMGYYMAAEGRRLFGQTMPSELKNKHIKTVREPVGVFGLVTPWNFPIAIPCWKIFPALVCGNTVVFKPSSYVPASAAKLVEAFHKAGLPPGVLNLVHGSGREAGDALIKHPDLQGVSFTGSTAVGRNIGEHCGKNLLKHSLEMGGKNVIIVMDDANLDLAVDGCIWGGFGTTGQRCTAASRVLVHQKVYSIFKKKFVSRAKKLKLGNGLKKGVDVGPLINEDQLKKSEQYMDDARKSGLKILCGGKRAVHGGMKKGFFFHPTIIDNPPRKHAVSCEEIFGPIVAMIKIKNFEDAIKVANDVEYGLSSAIFTQDVNLAHRASELLETGLVYINSATIGAEIQSPFGGVKGTGNGHREAGGLGGALETYTEMKVVNVDFSGSIQKAQGIDWD
jgi:alpha-ketoglutaric semialdehyde dehydrogenase